MSEVRDWDRVFREDLDADAAIERRLLIKEIVIIAIVGVLILLRAVGP